MLSDFKLIYQWLVVSSFFCCCWSFVSCNQALASNESVSSVCSNFPSCVGNDSIRVYAVPTCESKTITVIVELPATRGSSPCLRMEENCEDDDCDNPDKFCDNFMNCGSDSLFYTPINWIDNFTISVYGPGNNCATSCVRDCNQRCKLRIVPAVLFANCISSNLTSTMTSNLTAASSGRSFISEAPTATSTITPEVTSNGGHLCNSDQTTIIQAFFLLFIQLLLV